MRKITACVVAVFLMASLAWGIEPQSRGGSNYFAFSLQCDRNGWGIYCAIPYYHQYRDLIRRQLQLMRRHGQERLRIPIFHGNGLGDCCFMDSAGGNLSEQLRTNLANLLADLREIGYSEVLVGFFPEWRNSPYGWSEWSEEMFQENWNLICNLRPIIAGSGIPYRIDLWNEGAPRPEQKQAQEYVKRLWSNYNHVFGKADTVGFSIIGSDPERYTTLVDILDGTGHGRPYLYDLHFYEDIVANFLNMDAAMRAKGDVEQGWIIGETAHNAPAIADGLRGLSTSRTVFYICQWPRTWEEYVSPEYYNYIFDAPGSVRLDVSKTGRGSGRVVSTPEGIDCGIDCESTVPGYRAVQLTAIPDEGSVFRGWTGIGECAAALQCVTSMSGDTSVVARFAPGDEDTNDGMVAFYPFQGASRDESGNGNDGLISGPVFVQDRFGNPESAMSFDGLNDSVCVPNPWSLTFDRAFTISLWVQPHGDLGDHQNIVSRNGNEESSRSFVLFRTETAAGGKDETHFSISTSDATYGGSTCSFPGTDTWGHVAAVYDGGSIRTYINGKLDFSVPASGHLLHTYEPLGIGFAEFSSQGRKFWFNGAIDDLRVYDRALSENEVLELYDPKLPLPTVTIAARDKWASEGGRNFGRFRISRKGDYSEPLEVRYRIRGTATNGKDYKRLGRKAVIPANKASVVLVVKPVDDELKETVETVRIRMLEMESYKVGAARQASVRIRDND